jgi:hypothetical protein
MYVGDKAYSSCWHTEFLPSLPATCYIIVTSILNGTFDSFWWKVLRKSSANHGAHLSIPHATPKLLQTIDTCPFHRMHRIINS